MNMKKLIFFALMLVASASYAQNQEIRLFSHRGGRLEFDENTMSAFLASYDAGYRGFEIDVRLTKDGKMVLFHDNSLDRCTDSTGPLEDLTFEQAMKVRTKKGNKLCTLDEFLDFIKDSHDMDVYVEFEVKTNPRLYSQVRLEELCDKLYKAVNAKKPRGYKFINNLLKINYIKLDTILKIKEYTILFIDLPKIIFNKLKRVLS